MNDFTRGYMRGYKDAQKEALSSPNGEAQPEKEPVAWRVSYQNDPELGFWFAEGIGGEGCLNEPLYTTPPQQSAIARKPLTDEQIHAIYDEVARQEPYMGAVTRRNVVRAIEAAHGITKEDV